MTLSCAFWALPSSSLSLVWLADYSPGRTSAGRSIVLYDSRMQQANDSLASSSAGNEDSPTRTTKDNGEEELDESGEKDVNASGEYSELALFGSRLVVRETRDFAHRQASRAPAAILKESQIIIKSARQEDSGR